MIQIIALAIVLGIVFFYGVVVGVYKMPPYSLLCWLKSALPKMSSEKTHVSISKDVLSKLDSDSEVDYHFLGTGDSSQHGNTILINSEQTILVDTGIGELGSKPESASSVVEYLNALGIETIDSIIITHFHGDHATGLPAVLDSFHVREILATKYTTDYIWEKYRYDIEDIISNYNGIKYELIEAGDSKEFEKISMQFLSPVKKHTGENDNSIVTKIQGPLLELLLMGDAQRNVEEDLLDNYGNDYLRSDILQVGDHGRTNATTLDFLQAVKPDEAIIFSREISDQDSHPDVIDRLEKVGDATVYQTFAEGSIVFQDVGNEYNVYTCKKTG